MAGEWPLVSVIVPAYNVEDFVGLCLESLEDQTYSNLEIVVVDDGSTDDTAAAIRRVASRPGSRCRVLTQQNRGLSGARNAGLELSHGELVTFVDGDDTVSPIYVEALVLAMTSSGAQLSSCGFTRYTVGDTPDFGGMPTRVRVVPFPKSVERALYGREIGTQAWGKMASRSLWQSHLFPEGLLYEDIATIPAVLCAVQTVAVVSEKLYGFLSRPGSITRETKVSRRNFRDLRRAADLFSASLPTEAGPGVTAAFRARRAQELARCVNLLYAAGHTSRSDAARREILGELRHTAPQVVRDVAAPVSLRARIVVASVSPSAYRWLWGMKKSREGWY